MNRTRRLILSAPLALTLAACSGSDEPDPMDAGVGADATAMDAQTPAPDAGEVLDSGAADAGVTPIAPFRRIDAATLRAELALGSVQVVDVRGTGAFSAGHVPGAVLLPTGGLRGTVGGVAGQVVARATAEGIFEAAGVDPERDLVIVGPSNDTGTARALWTLALYGAGRVALLDGGYPAWTAAGGEVQTETTGAPTTWTDAPTDEGLRTDKAWLLDHYQDADVRIFDVRTPGEFAAGHIPGAVNVPWTDNVGRDGLFLDEATIRGLHGDPTAPTLVVYCQSGARASVSWTLLKTLGYEDVRLYDGSWNEWGADPNTPKETGN